MDLKAAHGEVHFKLLFGKRRAKCSVRRAVDQQSIGTSTFELKTGKISYAETEKTFDPKLVYGDAPNPTIL